MKCNAIRGMLPQPRNSVQNDFLNTMLGSPGWFFLGLTDRRREGIWMWNSDWDYSTMSWSNFIRGEPDGGNQQNCVAHHVSDHSRWNKKWTSTYCPHNGAYDIPVVCENRKYTIYHLTKETHE